MGKSIEITMDTGAVFYQSTMVLLPDRPYDEGAALFGLELDSWLKRGYFPTDDGTVVFTTHIATVRFVDSKEQRPNVPAYGVCACCGRRFVESTRRRPLPGHRWGKILSAHRGDGVCPTCYNTYGIVHGDLIPWSVEVWTEFCGGVVAQGGRQELAKILAALERDDSDLYSDLKLRTVPLLSALTDVELQLAAMTAPSQVDEMVADWPSESRLFQPLADRRKKEMAAAIAASEEAKRGAASESALAEAREVAKFRGTTPAIALFRKLTLQHSGTKAAAAAREWLEKNA